MFDEVRPVESKPIKGVSQLARFITSAAGESGERFTVDQIKSGLIPAGLIPNPIEPARGSRPAVWSSDAVISALRDISAAFERINNAAAEFQERRRAGKNFFGRTRMRLTRPVGRVGWNDVAREIEIMYDQDEFAFERHHRDSDDYDENGNYGRVMPDWFQRTLIR